MLLPYQLEPTIALINGVRRILIADDVGLGKTIQAGLAIAELRRRRGGLRALVLAPASLRRQWANELWSRFAITATMADAIHIDRLSDEIARGDSPWRRAGVWLI